MKKISVLLNNEGITTDISGRCVLHVYEQEDQMWVAAEAIPIHFDSEDLDNYKQAVNTVANLLDEDSILVAQKVTGMLYKTLDKKGVGIWEISGYPESFLDSFNTDLEEEKTELTLKQIYQKISEGRYYVDVAHLLLMDETLSSKKILVPFIDEGDFQVLHILFSHVPPWFRSYLRTKKMTCDIMKKTKEGILIAVTKEEHISY